MRVSCEKEVSSKEESTSGHASRVRIELKCLRTEMGQPTEASPRRQKSCGMPSCAFY